jgi:hypothetical protein
MKRVSLVLMLSTVLAFAASAAVAAPGCDPAGPQASVAVVELPGSPSPSAADLLAEIFAAPQAAAAPTAGSLGAPAAFCPQVCCFDEDDCDWNCPEPRKCVRHGAGCGRCEWQ